MSLLTRAQADRRYRSLGGNAAILMQRLALGQESASVLILGDSTGVSGLVPWPLLMAQWIAAKFPALTVNYRVFSPAAQAYYALGAATTYPSGTEPQVSSQVVQTGTGTGNGGGPFVLDIYNGSVSGSTAGYPIATLVRWTAMAPGSPQLVLVNFGHNSTTQTDAYRYAHYPLCRNIQQAFPEAGVIQIAQNPRATTDNGSGYAADRANDLIRARVVMALAASEGYGLVNITQRFLNTPSYATALLVADGLHPNDTGGNPAWADEVCKHLAYGLTSLPQGPYNRPTELFLSPAMFRDPAGALTLAQVNGGGMGWTLPVGQRSDLIAAFDFPEHWSLCDVYVQYVAAAGAAGQNVAWDVSTRMEGVGITDVNLTDSATAFNSWSNRTAAPGYALTNPHTFAGTWATQASLLLQILPPNSRPMGLRLSRRADLGVDTFAASVYMTGLRLIRRR